VISISHSYHDSRMTNNVTRVVKYSILLFLVYVKLFLLFRKYFYNYKYENVEKNIKLDIILIINIGGMIGMKIYYVRHGQTDLNLAKKMQGGGTEKELNETGVSQAYNTKKELENVKYDLVICSPMKRAKQTAEIINEGRDIPIITDERIRERKLGDYEGRDVTEEMENNIWDYKLNYNIPNGENLHDFEKRIDEFFDDIKEKYHDKSVLIVAHGGIAKVIKAHLYGMPESQNLAEISMNNCEIIETEI
jgi:broad specificity phosphatase PhoE